MKLVRQIECFAFALLVLFSSSYVMVGLHICGGQVQNIALYSKAESCAMEQTMPPCHRHASKPCCEDKTLVHSAASYHASVQKITPAAVPFVVVAQPPVLISEAIHASEASSPEYYNYDPPLRSPDLTVSLHVFLI